MKNLIIVGNGFDLAHGLETSYSHFIKDISHNNQQYTINPNNALVAALLNNKNGLWSDIESTYFDILTNLQSEYIQNTYGLSSYYDSKQLNNEFEEIKKCLEIYLKKQEENFIRHLYYDNFFSMFSDKDTIVLNFNYTNTAKQYIDAVAKNIELIHIHGELGSKENPIIFGYAADNEESKKLLNENNNEYVRNIKKFNYLFTQNEKNLKNHLKSLSYNVFILGHSCGISDKLILHQILTSPRINKIYPFYFENINGYFETMVNIDRIIDDYSKGNNEDKAFSKLVPFPNCYKIPQITDEKGIPKILKNFILRQNDIRQN